MCYHVMWNDHWHGKPRNQSYMNRNSDVHEITKISGPWVSSPGAWLPWWATKRRQCPKNPVVCKKMMVKLWTEADVSIPALSGIRYTSFFGLLFAPFFGVCLSEKRNPEDTSRRNVDEQDLMGGSLTVSYSGCLLQIWRFIQRSQSRYGKESWTGSRIYIMDMTHARWLKRFTKSASLSRSALPFSAKTIFWHCCRQMLL